MIDIQLLSDALLTVAFIVGLVIAISASVVVAAALHERHTRATRIRDIEQHLAAAAEQPSPAAAR